MMSANSSWLEIGRSSALLLLLVASISAVACTGSPVSKIELHGDIEVHGDRVVVHARDAAQPCTCWNDWPALGSCGITTDTSWCDCGEPAAAACLQPRVERNGVVVADAFFDSIVPGKVLLVDLAEPAELVLAGCGPEIRIPIRSAPPPTPAFTGFCADEANFHTSWTPVTPGAVAFVYQHWFAGHQCRSMDEGTIALPSQGPEGYMLDMDIQHQETELHEGFRVWQVAGTEAGARRVRALKPDANGRYSLSGNGTPVITYTIDGVSGDPQAATSFATAVLAAPNPNDSVQLTAQTTEGDTRTLDFQASPAGDLVTIGLDGETYTASVPHLTPVQGISGLPAVDEEYRVALSPTTMAASGGGTREIGFELSYPIGYVALPCD